MADSSAEALPLVEEPKPRLSPGPVPRHIAIIMDGNGRWAEMRDRPRYEGHAYGARSVRKIVTAARESGVEALTLYAFSVQNWERPDIEVARLMELLLDYLVSERETILKNGIRLQGIGQVDRLPPKVLQQLRFLESESAHHDRMVLTLALSYGSREEIVEACQAIARDVAEGRLAPEDISEAVVDRYTFTYGLPPLDLLIRTSGEVRLSNFLLWQAAYTEIVVTDVLWPDFDEPEFFRCIERFRMRERRYGKTGHQVGSGG
ncbi:MAG: polyprenyl diphosphate synthase [Myxococcota bacterium]